MGSLRSRGKEAVGAIESSQSSVLGAGDRRSPADVFWILGRDMEREGDQRQDLLPSPFPQCVRDLAQPASSP